MVRVHVFDVVRAKGESEQGFAVLLIDEDQNRFLTIFMAETQAVAIAHGAQKHEAPRPMTFELMANLLESAGVKLLDVHVESLKDTTFYASMKIQANGTVKDVDARPSDAIALALRTASPIYVSEQVMNRAGVEVSQEDRQAKTTLQGIQDLINTIQASTILPPDIAKVLEQDGKKPFDMKSYLSDNEMHIE